VKYKYFDQQAGFEQMDELQQHDKESFDFIHTQGAVDFHTHIKEFIDDMERKENEKKSKRELKKQQREQEAEAKAKAQDKKNNLEFFMV
jgi:predicted HTH transcriptional regulator